MPVTIALVDDDRNILTSVSIALQAEGFATRVYSDGEAALKALVDNPPDLAVLDVKMPKMDGMELLRRLRSSICRSSSSPRRTRSSTKRSDSPSAPTTTSPNRSARDS